MNKILIVIFVFFVYILHDVGLYAENWRENKDLFGDHYSKVDSIVVYLIEYGSVHFGKMRYRRDKIEEIYDYWKDKNPNFDGMKISFTKKREILMFMVMLKYMTPLDSSKVKVKPSEIIDTRERWWSPDGFESNDPVGTCGKIIIYNTDGTKEEGFISFPLYIDMFDWRYKGYEIQHVLRSLWYNHNKKNYYDSALD